VEVAGGDRGQAISPSPELTGLIGVGQTLCIALRITDGPANLCAVVRDEVFRILVWVRGGEEGARACSFRFLVGAGAEVWGRAIGEGGVQWLSHGVRGP